MSVGIVNYGLGNISAFNYAFQKLNSEVKIVSSAEEISNCSHLVLPGVGSFDYAMDLLNKSGLRESISDNVIKKKKPILGVCVGMQILFEKSDEGNLEGLGWIKGSVKKLEHYENTKVSLPHMGWNNINEVRLKNVLTMDLNKEEFYFLHSFYCDPDNKEFIVTTTKYAKNFCSIVQNKNIVGCQFHPEKSHVAGLKLLSNFLKIKQC